MPYMEKEKSFGENLLEIKKTGDLNDEQIYSVLQGELLLMEERPDGIRKNQIKYLFLGIFVFLPLTMRAFDVIFIKITQTL